MNILFDGRCINKNRTGIGNYAAELLKQFISMPLGITPIFNYARENSADLSKLYNTRLFIRGKKKYFPFSCIPNERKYDLLHEPNYIPAVFSGKKVITVCDMSNVLFSEYQPRRRVMMFKLFMNRMRNADAIITISESAKKEIVDILKVPAERVTVTYLGADPSYRVYSGDELAKRKIKTKYHLPEEYLLYVGTIEPRKNLVNLLEAFKGYLAESKSNAKLVLAGGKGWLCESIYKAAEQVELKDKVIFTGFFPQEDLPFLINEAKMVIYPSIYEGFGLPVLEAMSCGTPVLTSNVSSLPEVGGDAAQYFNPHDVANMAEVMSRVLDDSALLGAMRAAGLEQAKKFSWRKCAEETVEVYKRVLGI